MAEINHGENFNVEVHNKPDCSGEPPTKRLKTEPAKEIILARRLENILCCVVCLDLPISTVYQCSNGHLMCATCVSRLLADARIRDEEGKCPSCRTEFSKQRAIRSLAVENALSEFPSLCRFCGKDYPRIIIPSHESNDCEERLVTCTYKIIGCSWKGKFCDSKVHETECSHPELSGKDIMKALIPEHEKMLEERKFYDSIFNMMSFEKIVFNDLQLRAYNSDDYIHKLYYETCRFSAFFYQWVVKTRIKASHADASQSCERSMTYQLSLKTNSKHDAPIIVNYLVLRGPYGDIKVKPHLYRFEYTDTERDGPFLDLPLVDSAECNRLLASKTINFRLMMFIVT